MSHTAVKFHYGVLHLTAVFPTIWQPWGNISFASDETCINERIFKLSCDESFLLYI